MSGTNRPDIVIIMTDEERAAPPYEDEALRSWRRNTLSGEAWFQDNATNFGRHYTGSLACVPSRPTLFTGHYPDVHGVTQTDGLGKLADDSRLRWLPAGEVPTLGNWFRTAGYDTHYDGKWHISHADLMDTKTSRPLATNNAAGEVDAEAVQAYLDADPLQDYGFSGWVGPEPHGGLLANSGFRRDPLIANRVSAWLEDRYARRAAGDVQALRPFLLVASFVNPHDIVLWPLWARRGVPLDEDSSRTPPKVPASPTAEEDLQSKPAAQAAYRTSYASGYGPPAVVNRAYKRSQEYRDLYYRLHAEVDAPLDQVRKSVTDGGTNTVIVRTSDHGDLLGAHGGLHQKWFTLYDEATRVPFSIARIVDGQVQPGVALRDAPTSHVDLVPTLLAAASIDESMASTALSESFSEVHPLPGRNLMPVVDGEIELDPDRSVYLMTRDNMLEGDSGASAIARARGKAANPPMPLRIQVPAHVGANFEGLVTRYGGELWKLVRTFDDPDTWTEPGVRHLSSTGLAGDTYRTEPLPDQWELYNLTRDPIEAVNHWSPRYLGEHESVFASLRRALEEERARSIPERNQAWPYVARAGKRPGTASKTKAVPPPAKLARRALRRLGMHPQDDSAKDFSLPGRRALIVCTNRAVLSIGKATGVYSSEMTVPYYKFQDAGMAVDIASPLGGIVPIDPQSLKPVLRCESDDRFLADDVLGAKILESLPIGDLAMADYDIVFLAGGWGAAFDFATSQVLADKMTEANSLAKVMGGVCHGPLGFVNAKKTDGSPLVDGRRISAVTDKQIAELGIAATPFHPETELRKAGAVFESQTRHKDPLANHWVVDGRFVTGQNQNAGPMVAREMMDLILRQTASDVVAKQ